MAKITKEQLISKIEIAIDEQYEFNESIYEDLMKLKFETLQVLRDLIIAVRNKAKAE